MSGIGIPRLFGNFIINFSFNSAKPSRNGISKHHMFTRLFKKIRKTTCQGSVTVHNSSLNSPSTSLCTWFCLRGLSATPSAGLGLPLSPLGPRKNLLLRACGPADPNASQPPRFLSQLFSILTSPLLLHQFSHVKESRTLTHFSRVHQEEKECGVISMRTKTLPHSWSEILLA